MSREPPQVSSAERGHQPPDPRARLLAGLALRESRYALGRVSTAVLEGGDGPPIVFLHGPGEYGAKWLEVLPRLTATRRVIAPDLPGHGASELTGEPLDASQTVAWLGELIGRTCKTPPVVVAQLLGGAIAARYAAQPGSRLSALVLVDAFGLAPFEPKPEFMAALSAYMMKPTSESYDGLWRRCAFDLERLRSRLGETWELLKAYYLDRARDSSLSAQQEKLMHELAMRPISAEQLAKIEVPTTLVWGRHDLATALAAAEMASKRYGWPLHVIENAGDDPPLERPEAFLQVLETALADSRTQWNEIAPGYDETNTPTQMWIGNEGLCRAGLRAGTRFLDVASGSGALSIPAARLGAHVVAVDQSPVMLELLRARARKEKLEIETRVMDGHTLAFDDDTFDLAGSQFGVMLFPDMPKALREMTRVVKKGGRVLLSAYGDPGKIEFLGFFIAAIRSVRPDFEGPPREPPPLEFQLSDPKRLQSELSAAGLRDVQVETIEESTSFDSGTALWEWIICSNPIATEILSMLGVSADERGVVQRRLEELFRERAAGKPTATLTDPVHVGIGTK